MTIAALLAGPLVSTSASHLGAALHLQRRRTLLCLLQRLCGTSCVRLPLTSDKLAVRANMIKGNCLA